MGFPRFKLWGWDRKKQAIINEAPDSTLALRKPMYKDYGFNQYSESETYAWGSAETSITRKPEDLMEGTEGSLRFRPNTDPNDLCEYAINSYELSQSNDGTTTWVQMYENIDSYDKEKGETYHKNTYNRLVIFYKPNKSWGMQENGDPFDFRAWFESMQGYQEGGSYGVASGDISGFLRPRVCVHDLPLSYDHTRGAYSGYGEKEAYWIDQNLKQHRGHPYHYHGFPIPGVWNQIIIDEKPTYSYRGNDRGYDIPPIPHPYAQDSTLDPGNNLKHGGEDDTTNNYFDCMTYVYAYQGGASPYGRARKTGDKKDYETLYSSAWYFQDARQGEIDAVHRISTLMGAYDPTLGTSGLGEVHVSFNVGKNTTYRQEVRWAFHDMHEHANKFASGSIAPNYWDGYQPQDPLTNTGLPPMDRSKGQMPVHINKYYANADTSPCRHWWTDDIDTTGQDYIYVAVRAVQEDLEESERDPDPNGAIFRQICIPVDSTKLPIYLKD